MSGRDQRAMLESSSTIRKSSSAQTSVAPSKRETKRRASGSVTERLAVNTSIKELRAGVRTWKSIFQLRPERPASFSERAKGSSRSIRKSTISSVIDSYGSTSEGEP